MFGKVVEIREMDVDRYGGVVALVSVGDLIIDRHLIEYGYAWVYDRYCKEPFRSGWFKIEIEAKADKRGLWKNPNVIPPWQYRRFKTDLRGRNDWHRVKQSLDISL